VHDIEPHYNWKRYYDPYNDPKSPFYEKTESQEFHNVVYGYYLHPDWDEIGSETLYIKVLICDYNLKYTIIELIGEWNDTLHNDIMFLKRTLIDIQIKHGIRYFILIGDNLLNFHGNEDDYYQEWFDDVKDGWIVALNFRDFILEEFTRFGLDYYINYGGTLQIQNWRTFKPEKLFLSVNELVTRRIT
jgi:hypothetical protein